MSLNLSNFFFFKFLSLYLEDSNFTTNSLNCAYNPLPNQCATCCYPICNYLCQKIRSPCNKKYSDFRIILSGSTLFIPCSISCCLFWMKNRATPIKYFNSLASIFISVVTQLNFCLHYQTKIMFYFSVSEFVLFWCSFLRKIWSAFKINFLSLDFISGCFRNLKCINCLCGVFFEVDSG